MRRERRTKARYSKLFDDPTTLFPGCEVILFPNGEPEIWIRTTHSGSGAVRIRANHGPAGLMVDVQRFALATVPLTVFEHDAGADVQIVQYHSDPWSQAFKAWAQKKGPYPGPKPPADYAARWTHPNEEEPGDGPV